MNPVHLHLALNHVPVLGVVFALCLLLFASIRKSRELTRVSFGALLLVAVFAAPVYITGEPAEDAVKNLPGVTEAVIEPHEEAAEFAFAGTVALGGVSLLWILLFRGDREVPAWARLSTLALGIAVAASMLWTANLGGQIRHTEIRSGSAPALLKHDDH